MPLYLIGTWRKSKPFLDAQLNYYIYQNLRSMKNIWLAAILILLSISTKGQPVNDNCSFATHIGTLDGNYTFLSWDFNLFDTCVSVSNMQASVSYPFVFTDSVCNTMNHDRAANDVWFTLLAPGAFTIRGTQPQGVNTGTDSISIRFFRGDSCNSMHIVGQYFYVISSATPVLYDTIWPNPTNTTDRIYAAVSGTYKNSLVDFYLCFRGIADTVSGLVGCAYQSANSDTTCFYYTMNSSAAPFGVGGAAWVNNLVGQVPFYFAWSNGSTDSVVTDLVPGVYGVTITDAQGCTESDSALLLSDCSLGVTAIKLGPSYYRLRGWHADTLSPKHFVWVLNSDTLIQDSVASDIVHFFQQDTTYNVCLYVTDNSYTCSFDTCFEIAITNSRYVPLLDTINIWHYSDIPMGVLTEEPFNNSRASGCGPGQSWGHRYFTEYTGSDTLISGLPYKTLWGETNTWPANLCVIGFVREDIASRKVYFLDIDSVNEFLLYDFGMEIGDSIYISFPFSNPNYPTGLYILHNVIQYPNSYVSSPRKQFFLKHVNSLNPPRTLRWVEGVGNLNEFIYPYVRYYYGGMFSEEFYDPSQVLLCYNHAYHDYYNASALNFVTNPNTICGRTFIDSCNYTIVCGSINDLANLNSMEIAPNPTHRKLSIHLDVKSADNFQLRVMDIHAKTVTPVYVLGNLTEGEHTKTIELPDLAPGIYLLQCSTGSGKRLLKLVIDQ